MSPDAAESAGPLSAGPLHAAVTASPAPGLGSCFSSTHFWGEHRQNLTGNSRPPRPGHCRGGGCSVGGPTAVWGCSGDAGELLRRNPSPWGARMAKVGTSLVLCQPDEPSDHISSGSSYPKIPVRTGGDTTASSAVSPCSPRTPKVLPGASASLCIFPPSGPDTGSSTTGPSASPEVLGNGTKRAEKKGKGRSGVERRGRCQQAASSHLLPARGLPALRLMGTTLALKAGDTARSHPPPERSRVGEFRRGVLALPPWGSWVSSAQLSSQGGSGDYLQGIMHGGNIGVSPPCPQNWSDVTSCTGEGGANQSWGLSSLGDRTEKYSSNT